MSEVFSNELLHPWFDSDQKRSLQRAALATSDFARASFADDLALVQNQLDNLTVSPVTFAQTASAGQTVINVNGVATDQGELVLVFKNGLRLRPSFDYTVSFTLDPEVTTITLLTPATLGDQLAGVIYNIAVDSIGAVDAQARSDISTLSSNLNTNVDARIAATPINGLSDVIISTPANGQVLTFNGTNWVNQTTTPPATTLDNLTDVTITSPATGNILRYNGSQWVNTALAELIPLQDLSNVTITSPVVGHVLKWNGSAWVNDVDQTGGGAGSTNLSVSTTTTSVTIISDTGLDATVGGASGVTAGVMVSADKVKLDGIASGATANSPDATLLNRANHTGTQTSSTISDFNAAARGQVEGSLVAGSNVTITPSGSGATRTFTISSTAAGGGGGTVTSVGLSTTDSSLAITGSPVTGSGTISVTLNTVPVNKGGTGATTAAVARSNLGLGSASQFDVTYFATASHTHTASDVTSGVFAPARVGADPAIGNALFVNGAGAAEWRVIGASDISGVFSTGQIPNLPASQITSGTFSSAQIPNLDASKITTGTFIGGRLASGLGTDGRYIGVVGGVPTWVNIQASEVFGVFTADKIPSLDASKITTGTLNTTLIPQIDASKVSSGQFADAQRGIYVQSTAPAGGTGRIWIW